MASRRIKLIASAAALVLGAGGYFIYSVLAVQGRGTLAQAPLNVSTQIQPAFIMAVDDSGSMNLETLFATRDGALFWGGNGTAGNPYSFYDATGANRDDNSTEFNRLFAFDDSPRRAEAFVPPIDNFGMARSHEFNPAYYNPGANYPPWLKAQAPHWAAASIISAQTEPRAFAEIPTPKISPVFNLTALMGDTLAPSNQPASVNPARAFDFRNGMVIPAGTRYRDSACNGVINKAVFGSETFAQTVTNTCQMFIEYYPATYFLTTPTSADGNTGGTLIASAPGGKPNLYKYEIRGANYPGGATGAAYLTAIQSFANWFQYYRNRRLATVAAMTHAMSTANNMRVGFFEINDYATAFPVMRDLITGRSALYADMTNLSYPPVGAQGTPNRQAVARIGQQFETRTGLTAFETTNGLTPPILNACQRNAGMLFTDGYSNAGGSASPANGDGGMGPPFSDGFSNTMADIAANYYNTRLRTDLPAGGVPISSACPNAKLDCRTDLHMNFYGITLGALANLYGKPPYVDLPSPPGPANIDEAYDAAFASPPAWAGAGNDNPAAVDEIWHATINARGEFINAATPDGITAAMRRILAIAGGTGASPAGSIALTGARIGTGSLAVVPRYVARNDGVDWYTTLTAQTVSAVPATGEAVFTDAWEASARLPVASARNNVWFGDSAGAQTFTAANVGSLNNLCNNPQAGMSLCTGTQLAALSSPTALTITQAVAYLKGDQILEQTERNGTLRFRTTRLGDIINSTPVVSSPRDDYGYRSLPAPYGASYNTYVNTDKANRRPMVYAGANDGMLHAFDGRADASGGIERFAYIPQGVLGHMGNLLFPNKTSDANNQKFQHRYYVDGPVTVSDAYFGGGWKTALVGTTGAGARGAFALDVSAASSLTGTFTASDRLWDINDLNTTLPAAVRSNIGHVLGKPLIVPVKTGTGAGPVKWRAIFGNGYNSVSGKAVLFLVDMDTGAPNVTMIEAVETGPTVPPGTNGLGNIIAIDRWGPAADNTLTSSLRDGFADTVYAADQKGAIWKFDLRSATPANLSTPLFTTLRYTTGPETGTRQPILGGLTAAAGPRGGVLVYFGTGSFSFEADGLDTTQQSLYAVLDMSIGTTLTRADLLQQTVVSTAAGVRMTSSNVALTTFSGWYLDLPLGERFVGYPRIESGVVFMPTYAPSASTTCTTPGVNWLYGLNALTGGAGLSNIRTGSPTGAAPGAGTGALALATGGGAPVKDVAVLTSPRVSPLGAAATAAELATAVGAQCSMVIQVAGAPPLYLPRACGRQSWRQIQ